MWFIAVGSIVLNVLTTVLAANKVEPICTFFYPIAWYTFLVFISAINILGATARSGRATVHSSEQAESSPILSPLAEFTVFHWKNFAKTACISVFVWLIFELFNLRLKNWAYYNVPSNIFGLHIFGFLCFSTVLPGIFNIAIFFEKIPLLPPFIKGGVREITKKLFKVQPESIAVNRFSNSSHSDTEYKFSGKNIFGTIKHIFSHRTYFCYTSFSTTENIFSNFVALCIIV